MLTGSFRAAAVTTAEQTVAAPPISALMASIPDDGFREIPPLEGHRGYLIQIYNCVVVYIGRLLDAFTCQR